MPAAPGAAEGSFAPRHTHVCVRACVWRGAREHTHTHTHTHMHTCTQCAFLLALLCLKTHTSSQHTCTRRGGVRGTGVCVWGGGTPTSTQTRPPGYHQEHTHIMYRSVHNCTCMRKRGAHPPANTSYACVQALVSEEEGEVPQLLHAFCKARAFIELPMPDFAAHGVAAGVHLFPQAALQRLQQ